MGLSERNTAASRSGRLAHASERPGTLELRGAMRRVGTGGTGGRNLHDFLANKLGTEIVGGVYPPGSLLPNEFELRDRFAVSRTALREAYRVLTAKGLIQSRPKVGTRVRPKSDWNMLDPDILAWHLQAAPTEAFVAHLFQLRQMIEPSAAALAATSRSPEALERIAAACDDMDRYKDGTGDLIGADLQFHQAILEATGNYFIGALSNLILAALIGSFKLGWQGAATMKDVALNQHREVFLAIREQKPAEAQERMSELLRNSIDDVRSTLRRNRPEA